MQCWVTPPKRAANPTYARINLLGACRHIITTPSEAAEVRLMKLALITMACIWLGLFALIYLFQRRMIYLPSGGEVLPAAAGLPDLQVVKLAAPDGSSNVVWAGAAKPGQPTILYFHGNGGGLQDRAQQFRDLRGEGWGLFAMSYRGYSGSTGNPTEVDNVADAIRAYDALRAQGVAAPDIVLYGESLGSGVAVQVAAARPVAAVILESPYSSITDVAAEHYWFLPVRWGIKDPYDSITHVARVKAPILILAGATDTIVPAKFARRLADAIPGVKRYVEYPDGWHIDAFQYGGLAEVRGWVAKYAGRGG